MNKKFLQMSGVVASLALGMAFAPVAMAQVSASASGIAQASDANVKTAPQENDSEFGFGGPGGCLSGKCF